MKEIISEIVTKFLLMLVRTFFGLFAGGFLGTVVGLLVAVLLSLDRGGNQMVMAETLGTIVASGAILGALVGASNLLAAKDTGKSRLEDARRGNGKSGHGDSNEE